MNEREPYCTKYGVLGFPDESEFNFEWRNYGNQNETFQRNFGIMKCQLETTLMEVFIERMSFVAKKDVRDEFNRLVARTPGSTMNGSTIESLTFRKINTPSGVLCCIKTKII